MEFYNWKKIPESEKDNITKMIDDYDLDGLLELYYEYKIGTYQYCCGFHGMWVHFKDARGRKLI